MTDPNWSGSRSYEDPDKTPRELSLELCAEARRAAISAVRAGLEQLEDRYGHQLADEVAELIDMPEVFVGLVEDEQN